MSEQPEQMAASLGNVEGSKVGDDALLSAKAREAAFQRQLLALQPIVPSRRRVRWFERFFRFLGVPLVLGTAAAAAAAGFAAAQMYVPLLLIAIACSASCALAMIGMYRTSILSGISDVFVHADEKHEIIALSHDLQDAKALGLLALDRKEHLENFLRKRFMVRMALRAEVYAQEAVSWPSKAFSRRVVFYWRYLGEWLQGHPHLFTSFEKAELWYTGYQSLNADKRNKSIQEYIARRTKQAQGIKEQVQDANVETPLLNTEPPLFVLRLATQMRRDFSGDEYSKIRQRWSEVFVKVYQPYLGEAVSQQSAQTTQKTLKKTDSGQADAQSTAPDDGLVVLMAAYDTLLNALKDGDSSKQKLEQHREAVLFAVRLGQKTVRDAVRRKASGSTLDLKNFVDNQIARLQATLSRWGIVCSKRDEVYTFLQAQFKQAQEAEEHRELVENKTLTSLLGLDKDKENDPGISLYPDRQERLKLLLAAARERRAAIDNEAVIGKWERRYGRWGFVIGTLNAVVNATFGFLGLGVMLGFISLTGGVATPVLPAGIGLFLWYFGTVCGFASSFAFTRKGVEAETRRMGRARDLGQTGQMQPVQWLLNLGKTFILAAYDFVFLLRDLAVWLIKAPIAVVLRERLLQRAWAWCLAKLLGKQPVKSTDVQLVQAAARAARFERVFDFVMLGFVDAFITSVFGIKRLLRTDVGLPKADVKPWYAAFYDRGSSPLARMYAGGDKTQLSRNAWMYALISAAAVSSFAIMSGQTLVSYFAGPAMLATTLGSVVYIGVPVLLFLASTFCCALLFKPYIEKRLNPQPSVAALLARKLSLGRRLVNNISRLMILGFLLVNAMQVFAGFSAIASGSTLVFVVGIVLAATCLVFEPMVAEVKDMPYQFLRTLVVDVLWRGAVGLVALLAAVCAGVCGFVVRKPFTWGSNVFSSIYDKGYKNRADLVRDKMDFAEPAALSSSVLVKKAQPIVSAAADLDKKEIVECVGSSLNQGKSD